MKKKLNNIPASSAMPWSEGVKTIRAYFQGDRGQPLKLSMACLLLNQDVEVAIKSTGENTAMIHVRHHTTRNRNALATLILLVNQAFGGKGQWEKRLIGDTLKMDHEREYAGMEVRV